MYPIEVVTDSTSLESDTIYHQLGEFTFWNMEDMCENVKFEGKHFLISKFTMGDLPYARKQLTYLTSLMERHSGINVVVLFQGQNFRDFLIEDDLKLLDRFDRLSYYSFGKLDKDYVNQSLYPEGYNNEEYTLVDSKSHIRAQFNIEDARDIKKRVNILKLLDREFYQYKKTEVEQFRE